MIKSNYQRRPFIMANKKRNVYKPKPMTEGKKNLIQGLLQKYDIQSAEDIQDALKDMKAFAKDLKTIYTARDEEAARGRQEDVIDKWEPQYPNAMKRWQENWDVITPIFKFSAEVRKAFYTTNAIESLNSSYRRLNRQRSVFPSSQAQLKALYVATFEATKKWTMPLRNWGKVRGELSIMIPHRLSD